VKNNMSIVTCGFHVCVLQIQENGGGAHRVGEGACAGGSEGARGGRDQARSRRGRSRRGRTTATTTTTTTTRGSLRSRKLNKNNENTFTKKPVVIYVKLFMCQLKKTNVSNKKTSVLMVLLGLACFSHPILPPSRFLS
jgi:hypothetical protein